MFKVETLWVGGEVKKATYMSYCDAIAYAEKYVKHGDVVNITVRSVYSGMKQIYYWVAGHGKVCEYY